VVVDEDFASTPTCEIRVSTAAGADVVSRVDVPKGNASIGWSTEEAHRKFRSCAASTLGVEGTSLLLDRISALAEVGDVRNLLSFTVPAAC